MKKAPTLKYVFKIAAIVGAVILLAGLVLAPRDGKRTISTSSSKAYVDEDSPSLDGGGDLFYVAEEIMKWIDGSTRGRWSGGDWGPDLDFRVPEEGDR